MPRSTRSTKLEALRAEIATMMKVKLADVNLLKPSPKVYEIMIYKRRVARGKSWNDVQAKVAQLVPSTPKAKYATIKELIMTGLEHELETAEIFEQIKQQFPKSQAAINGPRHIAWYRCTYFS